MKKLFFFLMIVFLFFPFCGQVQAQIYEFQVNLSEQNSLDSLPVSPLISILPDKGNYATYFTGDPISLVYEAMKTGYVSILDYTYDEKVRILKNNEPITPGFQRSIQGIVTEPEGMERFIIILSEKVIPDRILVEAMNNPSRMNSIVGRSAYFNRCVIQVVQKRREEPVIIRFHPVPEFITSGRSVRIRLVMTDSGNNPLVNRRIQWYVDRGSLEAYQTYTNTSGETEVWFKAPSVLDITPIEIRASFEGDTAYSPLERSINFSVQPEIIQSVLNLSPKDFVVTNDQEMDFHARLTGENGEPLPRQPLMWESNVGEWEKRMTITDEEGISVNHWMAPDAVIKTPVELKVQYDGNSSYIGTEDVSTGYVTGLEFVSGKGTYFIDFSMGKPETNFKEILYRGEIGTGFALNPASALIMKSGEYVNVSFEVPLNWASGACYVWGKSNGNVNVHILLNNHRIFSGSIIEGVVSPLDFQSFHLSQFLTPGENHLRIEVHASDESVFFALQRALIVF